MTDTIRNWLYSKAYALVQRKGYHCQLVYVEERLLAAAKFAVAEAERVGAHVNEGGLFKQQTAMRMLSNIVPEAPEHDRALAVEIAIEIIRRG
jgi:hypothetical protein